MLFRSGEEIRAGDYVPSSDTEENEAQMQGTISPLFILKSALCLRNGSSDFLLVERVVDCPVCGQSIITRNVNEHLDSGCKSYLATSKTKQNDTKSAWNNILGNGSSKPGSRGKGKQQRYVAI